MPGTGSTALPLHAIVSCILSVSALVRKISHLFLYLRYNDGLKVETYNGDRSHDDLARYIDDSIKKYLPSTDSLPETTPEPDSKVAQNRLGARSFNTAGEVRVLNGLEQFDATLSEGPLFVKMYAPW